VVEFLATIVRVENGFAGRYEIDTIVVVFMRVDSHDFLVFDDRGPILAVIARNVRFPTIGAHYDGFIVAFACIAAFEVVVFRELFTFEGSDLLVDNTGCGGSLGLVTFPFDWLILDNTVTFQTCVARDKTVTRRSLESILSILAGTLGRSQGTTRLAFAFVVSRKSEVALVVVDLTLAVLSERNRVFPLLAMSWCSTSEPLPLSAIKMNFKLVESGAVVRVRG
jgi:hypothetical protein